MARWRFFCVRKVHHRSLARVNNSVYLGGHIAENGRENV